MRWGQRRSRREAAGQEWARKDQGGGPKEGKKGEKEEAAWDDYIRRNVSPPKPRQWIQAMQPLTPGYG